MKKYLNIFMLAAASILLIACDKNASKETVPTGQFSIVKANLGITPDGGECTIEVDATQPVTATPERDWCTTSVNGKIISVTATPNYSNESRYCRIKLESGGKVLYATVQQYGEVFNGLQDISDVTAPVGGRKIEVAVKTNVPIDITATESWIHPVYENGMLTIDIDKNDEPRTRFGTINYVAGSMSGAIEVTQYPELIKPESWVITEGSPSFDYPQFSTSASLSAEAEDLYILKMVPKSSVEGEIDNWIFDNLAVNVRNSILAELESNPEKAFKDYLTTGTDAVTFEDIQVGEAYIIAIGFGENGYVSGRYQYKLITIDDIRPIFYKWTGQWKVHRENSKYNVDDTWTITVKEKDATLLIQGIEGLSHSDGRYDVEATVDDEGHLILKTQNTKSYEDSSRGTVTVLLSGQFNPAKTTYTATLNKVLLSATLSEDTNSATLVGGPYTSSGVDYTFLRIQFYGRYVKDGKTSAISWNNGTTEIDQTITRIVE